MGFGLSLHDCQGELRNVRIWHNGLRQLRFNNARVKCEEVFVYTPKHTTRQFISYTDSKDTVKMFPYTAGQTEVSSTPPQVIPADAP